MAAQDRAGVSATATTSPMTCCANGIRGDQPAETLAAAPAHRPGPGTAPRRATPTRVAAQLAEQYARGGRRERAVAYYRRAADVAAGRFAHAEAIRLHRQALSVIATHAGGTRTGIPASSRCWRRWRHRSTPLRLLLARAAADAGTLDRPRGVTGPQGLDRRRHDRAVRATRFVQGRTADSYRMATRALGLAEPGLRAGRPGAFRRRRIGDQPGQARRGTAPPRTWPPSWPARAVLLSIGTRSDVHGMAWAAHAHWLLGHDDDAAAGLPRGHRAGPADRRPVQPGRGPGLRRHHPPDAP